MRELVAIDHIVRRVDPNYTARPGERLFELKDGAVATAGKPSLLGSIFGRQASEVYWFAKDATRATNVGGAVRAREIGLEAGAIATVDLLYSRVTVLPDGHDRLILGVRGHASMKDGLEARLEVFLHEAVTTLKMRDPGQWPRLRV